MYEPLCSLQLSLSKGTDKAEEDSNADTLTGLVSIKGILLVVSGCEVGR